MSCNSIDNLIGDLENCYISDYEKNKQIIKKIFDENVKEVQIDITDSTQGHNGKEGSWLEEQMGIKLNAANKPDILGFEMKKTSQKISFGDWCASEYLWDKNSLRNFDSIKTKDDFIKVFGTPKPAKYNRYSWSGACCPKKYNEWTTNGQILYARRNGDIVIYYSYYCDKRKDKEEIIPEDIRNLFKNEDDIITIVIWRKEKLKKHVENKFNQLGFFLCHHDKKRNCFTHISFGNPFDFDFFLEEFKKGNIFFDSGMTYGKSRKYSTWRVKADFWKNMITDI